MRQKIDTAWSAAGNVPAAADKARSPDLVESFATLLRRQYPIILLAVLLSLALGAAYLITTPPSFTARTTMIIDIPKVQLSQQQSVTGDVAIDSAMVESQVEILKSENIALAVIKDLRLTEDPEFIGPSGGLIGPLVDLVSDQFGSDDAGRSESRLTRRAVERFRNRLSARRAGLTYIIQIEFQSRSPDRAAQVANAITDAYIVGQQEAKYKAIKRASVWMQDRIGELREQASTAARAVVEFKTKNNIVDTGDRLMSEQHLAELNSQIVIARAQLSEAKARLDRIETVLRADSPNATVNSTVTDTLKNEVITKLRSQYFELADREADWSARYGQNHLAAVHLRNQMAEINRSILDELRRIAESYKSDYEIAKQRGESLQKELAQVVSQSQVINQSQVALRELESSAQTYRGLYDNFLQSYMESVQQQSLPIIEGRVITQATPPLRKSHLKTFLVLAITAAGGLVLGLGIGALRDRGIRTGRQVDSLLQADCIAVLPLLKSGDITRTSPAAKSSNGPVGPRTIARDHTIRWTVLDFPFSRYTEAIRSIKVAADLGGRNKSNKVIGVTSSLPNEGKSTVAASLALLMAHAGARVILVDCDLRNSSLTRTLAPTAKAGLIEVLSGSASAAEVIWTERSTNLTFLPMVARYTGEILASDATKKLFDRLREDYDFVVADLSPLAPVVDVRAMSHLIDTFLFVIEWGRTRADIVQDALNDARSVYENLLGVVLNKANMDVLSRYGNYRGNYYEKYY